MNNNYIGKITTDFTSQIYADLLPSCFILKHYKDTDTYVLVELNKISSEETYICSIEASRIEKHFDLIKSLLLSKANFIRPSKRAVFKIKGNTYLDFNLGRILALVILTANEVKNDEELVFILNELFLDKANVLTDMYFLVADSSNYKKKFKDYVTALCWVKVLAMNNKKKLKIVKALACRVVQFITCNDNANDYDDYEINISGELVRFSVIEYSDKQEQDEIDVLDFIDSADLKVDKKLKHIKHFSVPARIRSEMNSELLNVLSCNIFQALSYHTQDLYRFNITGDYEQDYERVEAYINKLLIDDNMNKFECDDSDDNHHNNSFKI